MAAAAYRQFGQTVARREVAAAEIMQFGQTESRRGGGRRAAAGRINLGRRRRDVAAAA